MSFGLLGERLGHSYSPQIHKFLGGYDYDLFPVPKEQLDHFMKTTPFQGINVTIPYKKAVIPYCKELSETAQAMGCVNTILRREDGSLYGHNTDAEGFAWLLDRKGGITRGEKALVLGTGGAAGTVSRVLESRGAKVILISRRGENHYGNLYDHKDAVLLVNATPVGMYPNNGESLVDLKGLPNLRSVLDLVYNPCRTKLLMDGEALGLQWENGLSMLVAQAGKAAELFTGQSIAPTKWESILCKLKRDTENIILIGMPGSGKSTIGRALAETLHRPFVDTDEEIQKLVGDIPAYFASHGETAFRKIESQVLAQWGKESGLILATGGGCVTQEENYPLLHQNGQIIAIDRPLELLSTKGRPLSQEKGIETLFAQRAPLYSRFADIRIENSGTIQDAVRKILKEREG